MLGTSYLMPSNVNPSHEGTSPSGTINTAPALPTPEKIAIPAPSISEPVKDQPKNSAITHSVTSHKTVSQKAPVGVVTSRKPGKVGIDNTIVKPEDAGKK